MLHNSLFLVAHFHNVVIGGVLFGAFAGYTYWFPKAFGFTLDEGWSKGAFWCWLIGFYLAFMPLYALGLLGATRRMQHYDNMGWQPLMWAAAGGALLILCGIICQTIQLVVSIRTRNDRRDRTGDPWDGRTLEWSLASPPPAYNYAVLPRVAEKDAFWVTKHAGEEQAHTLPVYEDLEVPKSSANGFVTAFFAVMFGFAMIWHIWWMAILGALGALATLLTLAWQEDRETTITVAEFERADRGNRDVELGA